MRTVIVVKVERYGFTWPECNKKGGHGLANNVDPGQTIRSSLIWVCTVCSHLSVPILRIFTVVHKNCKYTHVVFLEALFYGCKVK